MVEAVINSDSVSCGIAILGAGYDRTCSFIKGAAQAPKIIKQILDSQVELYERYTETCPEENSRISYTELIDLNSKAPDQMVAVVRGACARLYSGSEFIITLGGEHSVSLGPLQAIALNQKMEASEITVVQLDAHLDLREDDSDYNDEPHGKYAHCSVMRRASELGFNIVQVGARAYSKEELEYARKNREKITFFEWGTGSELFQEPPLNRILSSIKTKRVYLTIDVDGFDPSVMPETGTPVPGGFSWDYGVKLINKIFAEKEVIGADIVEVAPRGEGSPTAYNAAQLVYDLVAQHLKGGRK